MTFTVEHVATEHSGAGLTPQYRCHCGHVHSSPDAARSCRHRLRPVPVSGVSRQDCPEEYDQQYVPGEMSMPESHEPAQLILEVTDV